MNTVFAIGNTDRTGSLVITDTYWDHKSTLFVTVRNTSRFGASTPVDRMRSLARRTVAAPGTVKSSHVWRTWVSGGYTNITFALNHFDR